MVANILGLPPTLGLPLAVLFGWTGGRFHVWWVRKLVASKGERVAFYCCAGVVNLIVAALSTWEAGSVISSVTAAAVCFYAAWREHRGDRKKRPSRLLARVRDLGHRLVVAPAPAST